MRLITTARSNNRGMTLIVAFSPDQWFLDLTEDQKEQYIKDHPKSKYAKNWKSYVAKNKGAPKDKDDDDGFSPEVKKLIEGNPELKKAYDEGKLKAGSKARKKKASYIEENRSALEEKINSFISGESEYEDLFKDIPDQHRAAYKKFASQVIKDQTEFESARKALKDARSETEDAEESDTPSPNFKKVFKIAALAAGGLLLAGGFPVLDMILLAGVGNVAWKGMTAAKDWINEGDDPKKDDKDTFQKLWDEMKGNDRDKQELPKKKKKKAKASVEYAANQEQDPFIKSMVSQIIDAVENHNYTDEQIKSIHEMSGGSDANRESAD